MINDCHTTAYRAGYRAGFAAARRAFEALVKDAFSRDAMSPDMYEVFIRIGLDDQDPEKIMEVEHDSDKTTT